MVVVNTGKNALNKDYFPMLVLDVANNRFKNSRSCLSVDWDFNHFGFLGLNRVLHCVLERK